MNPFEARDLTRRWFLKEGAGGLGAVALGGLLARDGLAGQGAAPHFPAPHFEGKAKRVIYLHMAGSPSQLDLWDEKPKLKELDGESVPAELIENERFAFIKGTPKVLASPYRFARHGACGANVSELLPHTAKIVDKLTILRSMHTDQFNHAPAQIFLQTGSPVIGRPSMGAWLSYGLGSENEDLPTFVVMISGKFGPSGGASCWGSGFLPTLHQGVRFRSQGDPVLFLSNPGGMDAATRRRSLDALKRLNEEHLARTGHAEIATRIAQYELSYRMQTSVPELTDLSTEPESTFELYGPDARKPGTYAANCLLTRRMLERGVRTVQLFHRGWDQHLNLDRELRAQSLDTDQASAALVTDLARLGLLDDTLVIWGGEFGRTIYSQGKLGAPGSGRDHHGRCFTTWMAGGGVRAGTTYGVTDDWSYNVVDQGVHVHDFHATLLHQLGIDHERFTYPYLGLDQRLTGVEDARVVPGLIV